MPTRASLDRLNKIAHERILILDGGMGTMIQQCALSEAEYRGDRWANHPRDLKDNHDLLVLSQRQIISAIHRQYLDAGADIITTNTFNANALSQHDYGLESATYELNVEAARLARSAADEATAQWPSRPRFVAGSIGPSNRVAAASPMAASARLKSVSVDEMMAAYVDQVRGLIDGGADVLLLETIVDVAGAQAAIAAIQAVQVEKNSALPLMLSFTIVGGGDRVPSGETIEDFCRAIEHAQPWSLGINCAPGTARLRPHLVELSRIAPCWVSAHPNAGVPNAAGDYDETPAEFAALLKDAADSGLVNIVGGCCGTTPNHTRAIAGAMTAVLPRVTPTRATDGDLLPLEQARANRLRTDWDTLVVPVPWFVGHRIISDQRLDDLLPFVNATGIESDRARSILHRMVKERKLQARAVYGFWAANTDGDDVIVYKDDGRRDELLRFHMLRQQAASDQRMNLSLADFIAPVGSLVPDYIGAFALTAGIGLEAIVTEYEDANDTEAMTIARVIADRLAAAFAEFLHNVAKDEGGYGGAKGLRVSFGASTCPDLSENATLFKLLGAPNLGIKLTDEFAIAPAASIAGIYLSHPHALGFAVGRIGRDQLADYAARKGVAVEKAEQLCRLCR